MPFLAFQVINQLVAEKNFMLKVVVGLRVLLFGIWGCQTAAVKSDDIKSDDVKPNASSPLTVHRDIQWAKPKGFALTTDIYVPSSNGEKSYPAPMIIACRLSSFTSAA